VALVLAESEAAAQDGADLVCIDFEPLPAAVTIEQALAEDAPLVWPRGVPGSSDEAGAYGAVAGAGLLSSARQDIHDRLGRAVLKHLGRDFPGFVQF